MRAHVKPLPAVDRREETADDGRSASQGLQALLARPASPAPLPGQIVLGSLCAVADDGQPLVAWPGGPDAASPAASLVAVCPADAGRSVAISFASGCDQPLILGFVWSPAAQPVEVAIDGQHLQIEAQESITLRCGQASLTLTADGQVLLRGTYVSSHSSGTQRIKGAAVRIN